MSQQILPPQTAYRRRLSEMLDLTYELEGLLHIGVTRSAVPPRLNQLIVSKLNAIVALADEPAKPEELVESGLEPESRIGYDSPEENEDVEIPEEENEEVDISEEENEEVDISEEEKDAIEILKEDDVEAPEERNEDEGIPEEMDEDISEEEENEESVSELDVIVRGAAYYEPGAYIDPKAYAEVDDDFPAMKQKLSVEETPRIPVSGLAPQQPRSKGRLFSINDRFLFAREIFGGSLENFDKCMDEIITLDSYDEAEEYMIDEWNLDPDSQEGIRFLSIVSKLF